MSAEDHSGSTRHNRIDALTSKEQGWVGQQQKLFLRLHIATLTERNVLVTLWEGLPLQTHTRA